MTSITLRVLPAFVLLASLLAGSALAQPLPARQGVIASDGALLDAAAVERAAAPLEAHAIEVLVLLIEARIGTTLADAEALLDTAIEHYGLGASQLTIFIGTTPLEGSGGERPLYLAYRGATLIDLLERPGIGGTLADELRTRVMIPRLQGGDFTGAVTAVLERVARGLDQRTPSPVAAEQTPATASEEAPPTGLGLSAVILAVVLAGIGLIVLASRRRAAVARQAERAAAGARLREVESRLSNLLIDLSGQEEGPGGADPYLPDDPSLQTDMVLIRDLLADDRPEVLAAIESDYRDAVAKLQRVTDGFSALQAERGERPDEALAPYQALLSDAEEVREFTRRLGEIWQQLQAEVATVPDALAALVEEVAAARDSYPPAGEGWPAAAAVFAPVDERLVEARERLGARRGLAAKRALVEGRERFEHRRGWIEALAEGAADLDALESELASLAATGFRLTDQRRTLAAQRDRLRVLQGALAEKVEGFGDQVEAFIASGAALERAVGSAVALQQTNVERLADLHRAGAEASELIARGAHEFDAVDDFAPSNWRDIRGNGTEAQKAAERAEALYEQARAANDLGGDRQDFAAAASAIEAAFAELGQVRALIDAIGGRLDALRSAQATARRQFALVEADVSSHQALLARPEVDRRVDEAPAEALARSRLLLEEAGTLLAEPATDWLGVMARVQEADRLADEALVAIRTQQEAIEHAELRMSSEREEARGALDRLEQFANTHPQDGSSETLAALAEVRRSFAAAEEGTHALAALEEQALGAALERLASTFDEAQRLADDAFVLAERDFEEMERLRGDAAAAVAAASAELESLRRYLRGSSVGRQVDDLVADLARRLPTLPPHADRAKAEVVLRNAEAIRAEIARIAAEVKDAVERAESAARQERLRRVEEERRRRAADWARRSAGWGEWPAAPPSARPPSGRSSRGAGVPSWPSGGASGGPFGGSAGRSPGGSVGSSAGRSSGRSGGGWSGGTRKSGGGW